MRLFQRFIAFGAMASVLWLTACSDAAPQPPVDGDEPWEPTSGPSVMLHINSLNTGRSIADGTTVTELINTLRIIMIHEGSDGTPHIEANRLVDTHSADNTFHYVFQKRTFTGKKRFYLIANEGSVKKVGIVEGAGASFPQGMTEPSLSDVLDYFQADMPANEPGTVTQPAPPYTGAQFEALLQALCFDAYDAYDIVSGTVCLPYTAFYDKFEVKDGDVDLDYTDEPMYLVPVATKFMFKFINERVGDDVEIDYLNLASANRSNYLMANLNDSEKNKYVGAQKYYWIDWLKLVVDDTQAAQNSDDNIDINAAYGWISGYRVPYSDDTKEFDFVTQTFVDAPVNAEKPWVLTKADQANDGTVTATETDFGPFYLPESHHIVEETIEPDDDDPSATPVTQLVEKFMMKIKMRNAKTEQSSTSFAEVKVAESEISNMKAMFRNTSIQINIKLHQGGVSIYAETVPWNKKVFYGYVKDEDEIK